MRTLVLLCLLILPPQQKPETVALVLGNDPIRIAFVRTEEAERLYQKIQVRIENKTANEDDLRLHAALTVALGTIADEELTAPSLPNTRERLDWEIRRGVRPPLQNRRGINGPIKHSSSSGCCCDVR